MSLVERAYQLAAHGSDLKALRAILQREGYTSIEAHLSSPSLRKDLRTLIAAAAQS